MKPAKRNYESDAVPSIRHTASVMAALALSLTFACRPSLPSTQPVLFTAADLRQLGLQEAASSSLVQIEATVSHVDPEWNLLFLEDATGSFFADPTHLELDLSRGDRGLLQGWTDPGGLNPILVVTEGTNLGRGVLQPPTPVSIDELNSGRLDARRASVEGMLMSVIDAGGRWRLLLRDEDAVGWVLLRRASPNELKPLLDGRVRVSGVVAIQADQRRQVARSQLLADSLEDLEVLQPASRAPFEWPRESIEALEQFTESQVRAPHRRRFQGTVVNHFPDGGFQLDDSTGRLAITGLAQPFLDSTPVAGSVLDVSGYPMLGQSGWELRHALFRIVGYRSVVESKTATSSGPALTESDHKPLHSAWEVRSLDPREADEGRVVDLTGVVTYSDPAQNLLFFQDQTAGIFVNSEGRPMNIEAGQRIRLQGKTQRGDFAPVIIEPVAEILGWAQDPKPLKTALDELLAGGLDSQWVEVSGVIRDVSRDASRLALELASGNRVLEVRIPVSETGSALDKELLDAAIRVRGVCGGVFTAERQLIGFQLYSPGLDRIEVLTPPAADPFETPLRQVSELLRFVPDARELHRVRVEGTVTLFRPGRFLVIQDETGALLVRTTQSEKLVVGDRVECIGFPLFGDLALQLQNGQFRVLGKGQMPQPIEIHAEDLLHPNLEMPQAYGSWVRIAGRITDVVARSGSATLVLRQDTLSFQAEVVNLPESETGLPPIDALVEVMGVKLPRGSGDGLHETFQVYLQGTDQIRVIKPPPWIGLRNLLLLLGLPVSGTLFALAWVYFLRRKVQEQTSLIAERLKREHQLRLRYLELFESANDLIYTIDRESRLTSLNRIGCEVTGYRNGQASGLDSARLVATEEVVAYRNFIQQVLEGKQVSVKEFTFVSASGRPIRIEVSCHPIRQEGQVTGAQVIGRDVSERREAERRLRESQRRFRMLFDQAADSIFVHDAEGRIRMANRQACLSLGYTPEELRSMHLDEIETRLSFEEMRKLWDNLQPGVPISLEGSHKRKDGSVFRAEIRVGLVEHHKKPVYLALARDITERLNLEGRLRYTQKMETVGELAARVAHDFNNILTVLRGHAGFLIDAPELTPELRESAQEIQKSADRAAFLTRQLMAFGRIREIQAEPIDLKEVIEDSVQLLQRLLGEAFSLRIQGGEGLPPIRGDRGLVEQILVNLALNGHDSMEGGGQLEIRLEPFQVKPEDLANHARGRPGSYVRLSFKDYGCGIPAENMPKIFEPFFTTKQVGKGAGLGLATVYEILHQHDAWIEVESEVGQGSTFHLYFPKIQTETPPPATRKSGIGAGASSRLRVLLVEDEPVLARLVTRVLKGSGHEVFAAATGKEAMTVWEIEKGRFDVLLTDLNLPGGMSGHELASRLSNLRPELKVIFTSGDDPEQMNGASPVAKGIEFLPKPFRPDHLLGVLQKE